MRARRDVVRAQHVRRRVRRRCARLAAFALLRGSVSRRTGVQARLDVALSGRRCERLVHLRRGVLLLCGDGKAVVVNTPRELSVEHVRGEIEDVQPADAGALLRLADGRLTWIEHGVTLYKMRHRIDRCRMR